MTVAVLYTDTDAIRSVIGVDDADVTDEMITSQRMEDQMDIALTKVYPLHATEGFSSEALETKLALWCMWFGGLRLAESPLATPKVFSTGKDTLQRFVIDWEALRTLARKKLAELEEDLTPSAVANVTVMGKSTPDYNTITGV